MLTKHRYARDSPSPSSSASTGAGMLRPDRLFSAVRATSMVKCRYALVISSLLACRTCGAARRGVGRLSKHVAAGARCFAGRWEPGLPGNTAGVHAVEELVHSGAWQRLQLVAMHKGEREQLPAAASRPGLWLHARLQRVLTNSHSTPLSNKCPMQASAHLQRVLEVEYCRLEVRLEPLALL